MMCTAPSSQSDVIPSFGGLVIGSVIFLSEPGSSLVQEVSYNLTDDLVALEAVEVVTVSLDVSRAARISLGEPATTILNIEDDDGKLWKVRSD